MKVYAIKREDGKYLALSYAGNNPHYYTMHIFDAVFFVTKDQAAKMCKDIGGKVIAVEMKEVDDDQP